MTADLMQEPDVSNVIECDAPSRLEWINLFLESRNPREVCKRFGISKKTFYKWLKRYKSSNGSVESLRDRSRRPHRSPRATPEAVVGLLRRIHRETGYGQRRLKAHLLEYHRISLSERTIWKILRRHTTTHE
jgi:transposase